MSQREASDLARLTGSTHELALPMRLQIDHDAGSDEVELLQVFRMLPGRRLVALASWQGQQVVAKLFFDRGRWTTHLRRELAGITAMQEAGLRTAALVAQGRLGGGAGGVVMTRYIEKADTLGRRWEILGPEARHALLERVVRELAHCHQRGLIQKDIHLDNFLLQADELYLLDPADIVAAGPDAALPLQDCADNLALFLAQFPPANDAAAGALYHCYLDQRREPGASLLQVPDEDSFVRQVREARLGRWHVLRRKLYRSTSAHYFEKSNRHFLVCDRTLLSDELRRLVREPDAFIEQGRIIKAGNSATVAQINVDGKSYILKRYNLKSNTHAIARAVRPSRAWVSWRNAHMLQMFGVRTARPRLLLERRLGPLRRQAYFLTDPVPGQDVLQLLYGEPADSPFHKRVLEQFDALFAVMRQYRIVHGDLKGSNFISLPQALVVLDLDAMRMESSERRFVRAFQRDLQRFVENWPMGDDDDGTGGFAAAVRRLQQAHGR